MQTTRRSFLAATGLSAAAAVLASGRGVAAGDAKRPGWKTGLGLNGFMSSSDVFKKQYPLWEILEFAVGVGFDGIELVDGWPMGAYPAAEEANRVKALRGLYDRYGLRVYTFQTGGADAHAADPETRKNWLQTFSGHIRLAKVLGCDFVGHWPGGGLEGNANVDRAIDNLVLSYREAAKIAADAGLFFSFEIEPPFVFNTLDHLRRILEGVNHPACRTNYDPSHFDVMSGGHGKPEEMLRALGVQYIGHVHLTDTDGTIFNGTSKHLPCGEGHCDIAASLRALWEGRYDKWIMIDAWMIEDAYRAASAGKAAIEAARESLGRG